MEEKQSNSLFRSGRPIKLGSDLKKQKCDIFLMPTAYTNNRNSGLSICLADPVLVEGREADSCIQCMDGQCKESGQLLSASLEPEEPPLVSSPCLLFEQRGVFGTVLFHDRHAFSVGCQTVIR